MGLCNLIKLRQNVKRQPHVSCSSKKFEDIVQVFFIADDTVY